MLHKKTSKYRKYENCTKITRKRTMLINEKTESTIFLNSTWIVILITGLRFLISVIPMLVSSRNKMLNYRTLALIIK
uniref:G_PROTEIN_RECEP_F1_2 domain-containing protein n=1 Tax=Heterorhabditis bacteriophora TaxID=37862 RepID=A0A1I7W7R5_HETBA